MSIFDDLGKKLSFAMGETVSKTKEIANVTKLNTSIAARQHEIEDAYREMGRVLYEREVNDPNSPVAALCTKVTANLESIADMKAQIAQLKDSTVANRKARSEAIFGAEPAPQAESETAPEPTVDPEPVPTEEPAAEIPAAEPTADPAETPAEAADASTDDGAQ